MGFTQVISRIIKSEFSLALLTLGIIVPYFLVRNFFAYDVVYYGDLLPFPSDSSQIISQINLWHTKNLGFSEAPNFNKIAFLILSTVTHNPKLAQMIYLILPLSLAGINFYLYSKILSKNSTSRILTSILYQISPIFLVEYVGGGYGQIVLYSFLPLYLYSLFHLLNNQEKKLKNYLRVFFSLSSSFIVLADFKNSILLILLTFLICIYLLGIRLIKFPTILREGIISLCIVSLLVAPLILPIFIQDTRSLSEISVESLFGDIDYNYRFITLSTFFQQQINNIDALRILGYWDNNLTIIGGYLLIIFCFSTLLIKDKNRLSPLFGILVLTLASILIFIKSEFFFEVGIKNPYLLLFRNPSKISIFVPIFLLSLFVILLSYLSNLKRNYNFLNLQIPIFLFVLPFSFPFTDGSLGLNQIRNLSTIQRKYTSESKATLSTIKPYRSFIFPYSNELQLRYWWDLPNLVNSAPGSSAYGFSSGTPFYLQGQLQKSIRENNWKSVVQYAESLDIKFLILNNQIKPPFETDNSVLHLDELNVFDISRVKFASSSNTFKYDKNVSWHVFLLEENLLLTNRQDTYSINLSAYNLSQGENYILDFLSKKIPLNYSKKDKPFYLGSINTPTKIRIYEISRSIINEKNIRTLLSNRLSDCKKTDGRTKEEVGIEASLSGNEIINLKAKDHTACLELPFQIADKESLYLQFGSEKVSGLAPSIALLDNSTKEVVIGESLNNAYSFNTYFITPQYDSYTLYLYARPDRRNPGWIKYSNLTLESYVQKDEVSFDDFIKSDKNLALNKPVKTSSDLEYLYLSCDKQEILNKNDLSKMDCFIMEFKVKPSNSFVKLKIKYSNKGSVYKYSIVKTLGIQQQEAEGGFIEFSADKKSRDFIIPLLEGEKTSIKFTAIGPNPQSNIEIVSAESSEQSPTEFNPPPFLKRSFTLLTNEKNTKPSRYITKISLGHNSDFILNTSYSDYWELYLQEGSSPKTLSEKILREIGKWPEYRLPQSYHTNSFNLANRWIIDKQILPTSFKEKSEVEIIAEYRLQRYFERGLLFSLSLLTTFAIYCMYIGIRKSINEVKRRSKQVSAKVIEDLSFPVDRPIRIKALTEPETSKIQNARKRKK